MDLEIRYPLGGIMQDYARAGAGMLVVLMFLLALEVAPWLKVGLWLLMGLFGLFAWRTLQRQLSVFRVDEQGITMLWPSIQWLFDHSPGGQELPSQVLLSRRLLSRGLFSQLFGRQSIVWSQLGKFTLTYYSLRRDRQQGWMELRLKGSNTHSMHLDSQLDDFDRVLARAVTAAFKQGLTLTPATIENLAACGLIDQNQPPADAYH